MGEEEEVKNEVTQLCGEKKRIAGNYCTMYAATTVHELPLLVTSCDGNL